MQGASRASLKAALQRFAETVGVLPEGAGAQEVSDGLFGVADLLDREPSLRRALTDPASSPAARRRLVEGLLGRQLSALPMQQLSDLVADTWSRPEDLRDTVEQVAADAALRAAEGARTLDDVEDELFRFARLLEREPALRSALTDPALPDDRKTAVIDQLLGGRAQDTTRRLVTNVVLHPRGRSLETALDQLSTMAAQRRERYVAQVTAATPLEAAQVDRLQAALGRIYGRQVQVQVDVDPTVLGGVQVRIGDEVLDGTVVRKLATARRGLAG
jgi:F-type H+-transporting ATPase subunit delta